MRPGRVGRAAHARAVEAAHLHQERPDPDRRRGHAEDRQRPDLTEHEVRDQRGQRHVERSQGQPARPHRLDVAQEEHLEQPVGHAHHEQPEEAEPGRVRVGAQHAHVIHVR